MRRGAPTDDPGTPDGRPWAEQPRWRHDFPVDVEHDEYVSRRDFTRFMVLVSGAFAVGQLWIVAQNALRRLRGLPPVREIARLDALPIGGSLTFRYPTERDPCVLVRLGAERLVAFDQLCTHLSCPVLPRIAEERFHCPCHAGSFDLVSGVPLAGPPRRPLRRIRLALQGDKVLALGHA